MRRSAIDKALLRNGAETAEVCLDGAPRRNRRSRKDRPSEEKKKEEAEDSKGLRRVSRSTTREGSVSEREEQKSHYL